jgi:hypothetical protein
LWSTRKTVVTEFVKLISRRENVFETPLNGVGTDGSWRDFILGGKHRFDGNSFSKLIKQINRCRRLGNAP